MIYIFPQGGNAEDPTFKLDATLEERRSDGYAPTQKPIEDGAQVSDYVITQPKKYHANGIVTATVFGKALDRQRVENAYDAVVKLADSKTIVTVVFGWWVFDAVISNVEATHNRDIGEALAVSIDFQEIVQFKPETVQIPASKLKSKVKRRRKSKKGPSAETGKTPDEKTKKRSVLHHMFGK